jgi:hypothetical protein
MSEVTAMAAQMNTHGEDDDTTCPHSVVIVLHYPVSTVHTVRSTLQMSPQALNLGTNDFSVPGPNGPSMCHSCRNYPLAYGEHLRQPSRSLL